MSSEAFDGVGVLPLGSEAFEGVGVLPFKILPTEETGRPAGKRPIKAFPGDAGFDLFPTAEMKIWPGERRLVPTGVAVAVPPGYYGRIAERSGYGAKGLGVGAGVIDSGYRGEIMVAVYNRRWRDDEFEGDVAILVSPDRAVAQLIVERCDPFEAVEFEDLPPADRGGSGFGSSDSRTSS